MKADGAGTDFRFSDGAAYERWMGPWTRAVGAVFLDWLAIPAGRRWLDAGCGTGVFTELLLEKTAPGQVVAIDPASAQILHAREKPVARLADFRVADAVQMPFDDASFDVVASALVINFIPEQARALAEMRRVVRPGGCVAGYVWDFCGPLSVTRHVANVLRAIKADVAPVPGVKSTRIDAMAALFEGTGLVDVAVETIDVERTWPDFESYWRNFLESPTPAGAYLTRLSEGAKADFRAAVERSLPAAADGSVTFAARANAAKGFKPAA